MCTIEGNTGTIAATGTNPHTATTGCSHVPQAKSQALSGNRHCTTGTMEGILQGRHNTHYAIVSRVHPFHAVQHSKGLQSTSAKSKVLSQWPASTSETGIFEWLKCLEYQYLEYRCLKQIMTEYLPVPGTSSWKWLTNTVIPACDCVVIQAENGLST